MTILPSQVKKYRYYDAATKGLDLKGLLEDVKNAKDESAFLFHACAHNPTGTPPPCCCTGAMVTRAVSVHALYQVWTPSPSSGLKSARPSRRRITSSSSTARIRVLRAPNSSCCIRYSWYLSSCAITSTGFASGDPERDAQAIHQFVADGHQISVAQSFSKNFGLYGHRVGCISVVADKYVYHQHSSE